MILDGLALHSLHLLPPVDILSRTKDASVDPAGKTFSLLNTIDHCLSQFGRRLFRTWVCAPSCASAVLLQRQEAIKYLIKPEAKSLLEFASDILKKMPDLERLFQRYTF
jgi:DNA mismatch repair ATPase MutS